MQKQIKVWRTMLTQDYHMYITHIRLKYNLDRDIDILHQLYTQEQMIEQP